MTERLLIPVSQNGRWGYIDRTGAIAIPFRFSGAGEFRDGLARVYEGGEQRYDDSVVGGKCGFIHPSGEYVSKLRFDDAGDFAAGFAAVCMGSRVEHSPHDDEPYMTGGKYGYVNARGEWATPPRFDLAVGFREGFAVARQRDKYGFLDPAFQWAIEPQFERAYSFSEGAGAVELPEHLWTYMDQQGSRLTEARIGQAYAFSEGLAAGLEADSWRYIFRNRALEPVFVAPEGITHTGSVSGGLVWANRTASQRMSDGRLYPQWGEHGYGFLNREGGWAIAPQFEFATDFSEGLACVQDDQQQWGYIRSDGSWVIPATFSKAEPFRGGLARAWIGKTHCVIDSEGKIIWRAT